MATGRLITLKDIIEITSLSKATILRYVKAGKFPEKVRIGERRVAWREEDVVEWLASRENPKGTEDDNFTRVARQLADGTLQNAIIILAGPANRRVRMLRTDEQVVIERLKESVQTGEDRLILRSNPKD